MRPFRAFTTVSKQINNSKNGTAILSFNYGGHQEIIDAVNSLRKTLSAHKKVTAQIFEQFLYTPDVPPCDLIVRTSGEQRLSNFMFGAVLIVS